MPKDTKPTKPEAPAPVASPVVSPPVAPPARGAVPSTVVAPDPEKPTRITMGPDGRVRRVGDPAELPASAPRAYLQVPPSQGDPSLAPAAVQAAAPRIVMDALGVVRRVDDTSAKAPPGRGTYLQVPPSQGDPSLAAGVHLEGLQVKPGAPQK